MGTFRFLQFLDNEVKKIFRLFDGDGLDKLIEYLVHVVLLKVLLDLLIEIDLLFSVH